MPTDGQRRFYTTKPREIYFETIELFNANLGVRRFVARQFFDKEFTLEESAPRNGGETVSFRPANMSISPTTQEDQPVTKLEINLGEVGQMVKSEFRSLRGKVDQRLELIYRVYRGSDLTSPLNIPQTLYVEDINFNGDSVAMVAGDDNPLKVITARKYLTQDFPGLEVQQ